MTNETTASQPKSIEDDAQCGPIQYLHNVCADVVPALLNCGRQRLADLLEGALRGLPVAPAAQASATIQAAQVGMHAAVDMIDAKAQKYLDEHADTENDTGSVVFHYGEAGRDYHSTLVELAEELRLAATIREPVMVAEPVGGTTPNPFPEGSPNENWRRGYQGVRHFGAPDSIAAKVWKMGAAARKADDAAKGKPAAPMVADPAGVASITRNDTFMAALDGYMDAVDNTPRNSDRRISQRLAIFAAAEAWKSAATVKAVPSEAMSRRVGVPDNMIQWAVRELLGALPERRDWLNPDAEAVLRAEFQLAAPLADKTGGGE